MKTIGDLNFYNYDVDTWRKCVVCGKRITDKVIQINYTKAMGAGMPMHPDCVDKMIDTLKEVMK